MLQRELGRLVQAEFLYQRGLLPQVTYLFKHALIRDAAYESLLRSTRQGYHRRIAQVLEAQFPETAEARPELLAHHYTEAALMMRAIDYWQQAGEKAMQRSAYVEAVNHLTKGLELLQALPQTSDRTQRELTLQTALGSALVVSKGQGAHEVREVYDRAYELCQQVGDTLQVFSVLYGLWTYYNQQEEAQTTQALAEQLLTHAESQHDPALLIEARRAQVSTWFWCGEFARAHEHCEQGIALYTRQQHPTPAFVSGGTPWAAVVCHCLATGAWALWYLGYPDQALQRSQAALALARELAHSHSLTRILEQASWTHLYRREGKAAYELADEAIALATRHEFPHWIAMGTMMRGWALTKLGQWETGRAQMRQGIDGYWATGAVLARGCWLAQVAEAYGQGGQPEEGLRVLGEALALVNDTGMRHYEAEMHRLKGELLLQQSSSNQTEAESCFQQAIAIAQNQQAKSLELRAATSLARLWQQQGKRQEAYDLLAPVYNWFTEGFDTADLQDAKALLDDLS
jgi:predicted ATPase